MTYGSLPQIVGKFDFDLPEVMHYLYLPVVIGNSDIALPHNIACCIEMVKGSIDFHAKDRKKYRYIYLTARKGWASPDNPLNRPGWHCDGFGTDDMNFVWWVGPGTRFAIQDFENISADHVESLKQFELQIDPHSIVTYPQKTLLAIDPYCVHATPLIDAPGCWRQFIKISCSNHRYNLENNSHNYLFDYEWPLHSRETLRNDPHRAQADFVT